MLKYNPAILVAGGLFGMQIGLAAAQVTAVPDNDDLRGQRPLPAQLKYFEQQATSTAVSRGSSVSAPISASPPPSYTKYMNERDVAIKKEVAGNVYPTVKIDGTVNYVTVEHLGTVKFVDNKGQSFVWQADTFDEKAIPAKAIAPAGFNAGDTIIYVRHPNSHIPG